MDYKVYHNTCACNPQGQQVVQRFDQIANFLKFLVQKDDEYAS